MFALVDCNNFYASCERVFQPELRGRPLIVLSNNDGCVIAKSDEAKKLGFGLGDPFFEVRDKVEEHDVAVRSSNYTLYGDMSRRVVQTLDRFTPHLEEYSIDEVFLGLSAFHNRDLTGYGERIASTVRQWTGIPVSVAIAPTKTLAKIAMEVAKREGRAPVQNTRDWTDEDEVLAGVPIEDVWGIGPAYSRECRSIGISSALELKQCDPRWAKDHLTVTGLRRKRELQGTSCIPLEEHRDPKQHITCSRMFGEKITDYCRLRQAVSLYATRAAARAREEGECAGSVQVFIRTSRFEKGPRYTNLTIRGFDQPTDATHVIARHAVGCLKAIFRSGYRYHKAGVILGDLVPKQTVQRSLTPGEASAEDERVMDVIDEINEQYGRDAIAPLSNGIERDWTMNRDRLSRRYSTRWNELKVVKAG